MSSKSRRGVYMGTRPKTRYNDLISTSITTGGVGYTHIYIHIHIHMTYQERCVGQPVLLGGIGHLPCRGTEVTYGVLPAQEAVPSLFDIRCLFFSSFFFFVVYLIISPTLFIFHLLVYLLRIFLVFLLVTFPLAFGFPFFSFIVGRDAILLNLYAYAMQIRKRISVAALEWSGC